MLVIQRLIKNAAASVCFLLLVAPPVFAHEYWLAPLKYEVAVGKKIQVDFRNGENFIGRPLVFQSSSIKSMGVMGPNGAQTLNSREGEFPAINIVADAAGYFLIHMESGRREVIYESVQKFEDFLTYHGLDELKTKHSERNLPSENIREEYYRYTKTIVEANKTGTTQSHPNAHLFTEIEQELELIPLENPLTESAQVSVKVLFRKDPLPNHPVMVFRKLQDNSVENSIVRTNQLGIAVFDISLSGKYLINAIQVEASNTDEADWKSLWASLTFEK